MPWTLIDKRKRKEKKLQSYLKQYIRALLLQQHGIYTKLLHEDIVKVFTDLLLVLGQRLNLSLEHKTLCGVVPACFSNPILRHSPFCPPCSSLKFKPSISALRALGSFHMFFPFLSSLFHPTNFPLCIHIYHSNLSSFNVLMKMFPEPTVQVTFFHHKFNSILLLNAELSFKQWSSVRL